MLPKRLWHEMTARDFADGDTSRWIAVLPVAAIEQHGPHLPVYTDTCIAEGMVKRAIELTPAELPVTFLPVQAVGKSNEHISSPGTVTATWETTTRLWIEIGESVQRAGLRKLIIVNAHGGNVPMIDIVTRELRVRYDMVAVGTAWSRFGYPAGVATAEESAYGIHGGDYETSQMLHFRPDLVKKELAEDFGSAQQSFAREFRHLRAHGPHQFGWKAQDLNAKGTVGNAARATAEKGRAITDHQALGFVELCADVYAFDPARLWRPR
jgi:creatinine amidohydrolase